jgi:hypothetical protein
MFPHLAIDTIQVNLPRALRLIKMARYLEHMGYETPFNFSSAQVITKWMVEAAPSDDPCFAAAIGPIGGLYDSFALKSGHGLTQLWSTLVPVSEDSTVLERFSKYECTILKNGEYIL